MTLRSLQALLFAVPIVVLFSVRTVGAQQLAPGEGDLPERLDTEWVLKYEQSFGVRGLYVQEPPPLSPSDVLAMVRRDLIDLTLAAEDFLTLFPNQEPTPQALLARGLVDRLIRPPEGTDHEYVWLAEEGRFVSTEGGAADIVYGAAAQLRASEDYRRRVIQGGEQLRGAWRELLQEDDLPELIRREIEAREFALDAYASQRVALARRTQELLQELNDAIEMAATLGHFEPGQEITMQDVGRTGFIDLLEALPLGGEYRVSRVGEPPVAVIRGTEVPLEARGVDREARRIALQVLRERPGYPPALALAARPAEPEEALRLINQAVEEWPDVPALRIQRIATNAAQENFEEMNRDLDFLLARFPSAPVLIEIDLATRTGILARAADVRVGIATAMADIRPEVLNIQLLALSELLRAGDSDGALAIYNRMVQTHPGYRWLLRDEVLGTE